MIKLYVRLFFCFGIVAWSLIASGNDRVTAKPGDLPFPSGSCTDRCHVNYLAYYSVYEGEIFRHKSHSPPQGLECNQCHNNNAIHTQTHGELLIRKKDCWVCHHKRGQETSLYQEDCFHCHTEVKAYQNGEIHGMGIKIPDWMSAAVSCTDCHKTESDGLSFKAVRDHCIECHNNDYGLLHDAWKETLEKQVKQYCENDTRSHHTRNLLRLVQSYGMHNFRLSQILLKSMTVIDEGKRKEKNPF